MKIWISCGEVSGDIHGAELAKALLNSDNKLTLMGMGGPELRKLHFNNYFNIEDLSVMGISEVVKQLPRIMHLIKKVKAKITEEKPDALIVIDAPDFNFRLIKHARKLNIPVYYYISPKIWAWRSGRAKFLQKNVRKVLSILPFEVDFYKKFKMVADYVGNPLLDEIDLKKLDLLTPDKNLIGLMPGSRKKEISSLLPQFSKTASILHKINPNLKFICAQAPTVKEEFLRSFWSSDLPLEICPPENRYELMRKSSLLISASGTAVLESAIIGTPTILCYKVSLFSYLVGRALLNVKYVGLPNLILNHECFPELLQAKCDSENLAPIVVAWVNNEAPKGYMAISEVQGDLKKLRTMLGEAGVAKRAANVILGDIASLAKTSPKNM